MNDAGGFADFVQQEIVATGDIDENAAGAVNRGLLEQAA